MLFCCRSLLLAIFAGLASPLLSVVASAEDLPIGWKKSDVEDGYVLRALSALGLLQEENLVKLRPQKVNHETATRRRRIRALKAFHRIYSVSNGIRSDQSVIGRQALINLADRFRVYADLRQHTLIHGSKTLWPFILSQPRDWDKERSKKRTEDGADEVILKFAGGRFRIYSARFALRGNPPLEMYQSILAKRNRTSPTIFQQSKFHFVAGFDDVRRGQIGERSLNVHRHDLAFVQGNYLRLIYIQYYSDRPPAGFQVPPIMEPLINDWASLYAEIASGADQESRLKAFDAWRRTPRGLRRGDIADVKNIIETSQSDDLGRELKDLRLRWAWRRFASFLAREIVEDFQWTNQWSRVRLGFCHTVRPRTHSHVDIRVVFATNRQRKRDGDERQPETWFADDSTGGQTLTVGCASISVPKTQKSQSKMPRGFLPIGAGKGQKIPRDLEDKFFVRKRTGLQERPVADAARRLYLLDMEADRVRSRRRALVLIHGYNTPFEQALLRVAQLASEVNYPGRIYLFSWPSQNSTVRYLSDMERAEQSEPYLSGFLRGIARDPQIREIDFIAHSMGAQILTRALGEISDIFFAREKIGIGQVILVAPDVAVEVFSEKWRGLMPLVKGLTIFSSKADWPLGISRYLRGSERRLGQILDRNKLSLQNNFFRIVDVTPERSVCNGWGYAMLGHNHFRNVPEMRLFIKRILRKTSAQKDFSAKEKALLEAPKGTARLKMKAPACF